MLSTQALREQLNRYADGQISADVLEEWLASESWDMRRWAPIGLQRVVEAIQSMFIQYSDGVIDRERLKDYLLGRRRQLQLADKITREQTAAKRALDYAIMQAQQQPESIADSQALMIEAISQ